MGGNQTERGGMGAIAKPQNEKERNVERMGMTPKRFDHEIDMSNFDMMLMEPPPLPPPPSPPSPPPPPPPPPLSEKVIVKPIMPDKVTTARPSVKTPKPSTFAKSFTIAALQQYTNSFSQENLIGGGMLGSVYRAELPDGKV